MTVIEHALRFRDTPALLTVADAESVLSDWFGADVILTSSGRAAIHMYLQVLGLNRYRSRIVLPRLISVCVVDAVIRSGFPVDAACGIVGDASILYHQFGIPQCACPSGIVIEDICHALFASPSTGIRDWKGEVAVFSLPKFLGLSGMVGGLVMVRGERSARLREMRIADASEASGTGHGHRPARAGFQTSGADRLEIESMYLSRLLNPRLLDDETGGLPGSISELQAVGRSRQQVLARLMNAAGRSSFPPGWFELLMQSLPFALPVFGDRPSLERMSAAMLEIEIKCGEYQIDVARNMSSPRYDQAILVPCHHEIPTSKINEMVEVLTSARR